MLQLRKLLSLPVALGAALVALALVAPLAQAKEPAPGYEQFAGCPSKEEIPTVTTCSNTVISGGFFKMGSKEVPITNPLVLKGGIAGTSLVANSKGGLAPVKEKVPGGVVGLTGLTWLLELLGSEALTLYAVTELAGIPDISTGLRLPIKVHLINPVLGNSCYVGSVSEPIVLNLTTGTTAPPPPNEPISGVTPTGSIDSLGILHQTGGTFVDNSFAAPGANGCKLTLFGFIPINLDSLVDLQSGLPAAAGTNTTVQNFDLESVAVKKVYPPKG